MSKPDGWLTNWKMPSPSSRFDEGPDLVLYYKHLLVLLGNSQYEWHFNQEDRLSPSQQSFAKAQLNLFQTWWKNWAGKTYRT